MTATDPSPQTSKPLRTWRPMALWTAAILAGLALLCGGARLYADLEGTRRVLKDVTLREYLSDMAKPDEEYLWPERAVVKLGGQEEAARRVVRYQRLGGMLPGQNYAWVCPGVLGQCGRAGVLPLVMEYRRAKDDVERSRVVCYLGGASKAWPEEGLPVLVEALGDRERGVRLAAAFALGDLGSLARSALPAIEKAAAGDSDKDVRDAATRALWVVRQAAQSE
jgi:hypothetical protein